MKANERKVKSMVLGLINMHMEISIKESGNVERSMGRER
jgi:hypothetical protein